MLRRVDILPRFSALVRTLNTSRPILNNNENPESLTSKVSSVPKPENAAKLNDKTKPKRNTQLIKSFKNNNVAKAENTKKKMGPLIGKAIKVPQAHQETYNVVLANFSKHLDSPKNLIATCQELNDLIDLESTIATVFTLDPVKSKVSPKLLELIKSKDLSNEAFLTIMKYLVNVDIKYFGDKEEQIMTKISGLNVEELLNLITFLRTMKMYEYDFKILPLIRDKSDDLADFKSIIKTIKLFQSDKYLIKSLENKLLLNSDKLTADNWIDLLNTNSIIKNRSIKVIEACVYNISNQEISLSSIQQCLLSCGILNYRDEQFFNMLVSRFKALLIDTTKDSSWVDENKKDIFSVISSIGMLGLRDKSCLNTLCDFFEKNCIDNRVLINFVITCGSLNYDPHSIEKVISKIKVSDFNVNMGTREKIFLLNYVWSLCMLKQPSAEFIKEVLQKSFWEDLINEDSKNLKPILVKLLNINLYTQLFVDSYEGPLVNEEINVEKFKNILRPDAKALSANFISTLSTYRTAEKYFKSNMLTPYGIVIDALMIINENGVPCQLQDYLNKSGQLEMKNEKERKIAFKLVDYKDIIQIGHKLNGNLSMQLLLLKELGYTPITVTYQELLNSTVIQRVNLIKKKLEKTARH